MVEGKKIIYNMQVHEEVQKGEMRSENVMVFYVCKFVCIIMYGVVYCIQNMKLI